MYLLIIVVVALVLWGWEGTLDKKLHTNRLQFQLIWSAIKRRFQLARSCVVTSAMKSTWAVVKRWGIRLPGAFTLLPGPKENLYTGRSRAGNRYLAHQFLRLEKARAQANPQLYWTIGQALILRSRSYRMAALAKSLPKWYWSMESGKIRTLLMKVEKLVKTRDYRLVSHRVYIPKADGIRVRSLGVPTIEWRIILTMWTTLLYHWLSPMISDHQYGGMMGRGAPEAWADILKKVVKSPDIFEYDLKGFFNSYKLAHLHHWLETRAKIPEEIVDWLYAVNANNPTPPKEGIHPSDPEIGPSMGRRLGEYTLEPKLTREIYPPPRIPEPKAPSRGAYKQSNLKGIPQGTNWAPILSNYLLECTDMYRPYYPTRLSQLKEAERIDNTPAGWWAHAYEGTYGVNELFFDRDQILTSHKKWKTIQFIDDGLYYGWIPRRRPGEMWLDNPIWDLASEGTVFDDSGLEFSDKPGAVGWVKRNGIWKKPLKFLGITYNPEKNVITSETSNKEIPVNYLIRLSESNPTKYNRTIMGLNPRYNTARPEENEIRTIKPGSPLHRYCKEWGLTSQQYADNFLMHVITWTIVGSIIVGLETTLSWECPIYILSLVSSTFWKKLLPGPWSLVIVGKSTGKTTPTVYTEEVSMGYAWVNWSSSSTHFAAAHIAGCRKLVVGRPRAKGSRKTKS